MQEEQKGARGEADIPRSSTEFKPNSCRGSREGAGGRQTSSGVQQGEEQNHAGGAEGSRGEAISLCSSRINKGVYSVSILCSTAAVRLG